MLKNKNMQDTSYLATLPGKMVKVTKYGNPSFRLELDGGPVTNEKSRNEGKPSSTFEMVGSSYMLASIIGRGGERGMVELRDNRPAESEFRSAMSKAWLTKYVRFVVVYAPGVKPHSDIWRPIKGVPNQYEALVNLVGIHECGCIEYNNSVAEEFPCDVCFEVCDENEETHIVSASALATLGSKDAPDYCSEVGGAVVSMSGPSGPGF